MAKKKAARKASRKRIVMTVGPHGPMARHGWKITCKGVFGPREFDVIVTEYHPTQAKAIRAAAKACRGMQRRGSLVELKIKDRTGTIRDGRTYGKDPRRIKG